MTFIKLKMSWRFASGVFVSLIFFFLTQDFYKRLETQTWSHFNPRKADRLGAFWGVLKINNNSGLNGNVAVRCAACSHVCEPGLFSLHILQNILLALIPRAPNSGYPISHKCIEAWLRPQILGSLFFCWNQSCSTQGLFLGSVWHLLVPARPLQYCVLQECIQLGLAGRWPTWRSGFSTNQC